MTKIDTHESSNSYSRIVHALAVVLTISVFPLIWVGGLVTTYDAGMAVPDWPGTYGWNMFAYPASTWLYGPFDLLVEHSHRLLASLAGFLSIGLLLAAWAWEQRRWFRWWCAGVLLAIIAQGALGGARVLFDQRTFAMIHGCTGPLFFAIATATAVMSSRWWRVRELGAPRRTGPWGVRLSTSLVVISYLQLVMGAQLRHVTGAMSNRAFMGYVHTHLSLAALVFLLTVALFAVVGLSRLPPGAVRRPVYVLALLVLVQIVLGIGTWVVNYALPWPEVTESLAGYTILAKGYWESFIVTAHMATGSLIVSLATLTALRAWRSSTKRYGAILASEAVSRALSKHR
ncbi:COX15/CtaA family protein [Aureliella helgolandensis]|uniref:Heme A synthase n=1 Tax=Aureliella helgolandensis TaxID=2527968 RepID=A0A518GH69_9BACT|nr:COX15/CtaA family protein [Aureliella helgolandensis]QDV27941.1 Heme A synthase [Aureliella helgolandensis]